MVLAYDPLHHRKPVTRAQGPTPGQHLVVQVFQPNTCDPSENVERVQHLLQVDQAHVPFVTFGRDYRFESGCGTSMSTPGIKVNEIDLRAWQELGQISIL